MAHESGSALSGSCTTNGGAGGHTPIPVAQTVKEYYDEKIAHSRKTTEQLCIAKAKMEVLGLLDHPHQELQNLIGGWFN